MGVCHAPVVEEQLAEKEQRKDPPGYFSRGWVESGRAPLSSYPIISFTRIAAFGPLKAPEKWYTGAPASGKCRKAGYEKQDNANTYCPSDRTLN